MAEAPELESRQEDEEQMQAPPLEQDEVESSGAEEVQKLEILFSTDLITSCFVGSETDIKLSLLTLSLFYWFALN